MSAMPHHAQPLAEFDDEDTLRPTNGRMPGAQPLRPDIERELPDVLHDHAAAAWGELRRIDKLNSQQATRILSAAMGRLLESLKKAPAIPKGANRTEEYRSVCIKLRAALMRVWGEPKKAGDANLQSQKTCRVCGQLKDQHKDSCLVGIALAAAAKSGVLK